MTKRYTLDDFARLFDHTNLQPDATDADMRKLCDEALENHFCMVAINSGQSARCHAMLEGTDIHVGAAIGFPLGQTSIACKTFETKDALAAGADEIDYVVNLTEVKEGNWAYVTEEMRSIVDACREETDRRSVLVPSKVIFENCLLTHDEKLKLCEIAREVEPTFVKTSTGFSTGGATVDDVRLMRENVGPNVKVKAAGKIRDAETMLAMVAAGAERIGARASVAIMDELRQRFAAEGLDYLEI
ncbi:MAG: deoxyribose-phosphate aldolase [Parolsenella sp.]|uniref:deoxyribose-phosphate aldolase n=1 Tax=Parolsenella sp. TaxID=2083006 RepID=UPI002A765CB9|nr:deoxyribose-phosphate aldolase [Parolsenella sp.]MDY3291931.1 deoxyribose-phosphate aldolase [Parolsenella sp.]